MIWQEVVFLVGSVFSLVVLVPTLRDPMANIPLGTSLPSALIGLVYGGAFLSMGMTLSGVGALMTGIIWSLIAGLRSPRDDVGRFGGDPARAVAATWAGATNRVTGCLRRLSGVDVSVYVAVR